MTERHGKLLTCLPFSYLLHCSLPFNGIFFLPGLQQWFYFCTHTSQMPPLTGILFLASLTALSSNVTSSVHFSYTPTGSEFLWEWKTKEEKEGKNIEKKNKRQRPSDFQNHLTEARRPQRSRALALANRAPEKFTPI